MTMAKVEDARIMVRINDGGGWYPLSLPEVAEREDFTESDVATIRAMKQRQMFRTASGVFVERTRNFRMDR